MDNVADCLVYATVPYLVVFKRSFVRSAIVLSAAFVDECVNLILVLVDGVRRFSCDVFSSDSALNSTPWAGRY